MVLGAITSALSAFHPALHDAKHQRLTAGTIDVDTIAAKETAFQITLNVGKSCEADHFNEPTERSGLRMNARGGNRKCAGLRNLRVLPGGLRNPWKAVHCWGWPISATGHSRRTSHPPNGQISTGCSGNISTGYGSSRVPKRCQRMPSGPRENHTCCALPTTSCIGTVPNLRESVLAPRLSPRTKT